MVVRLFVGGLPQDISVLDLHSRFSPFGSVERIELIPVKDEDAKVCSAPSTSSACRGFAYVELKPKDEGAVHKCLSVYNHSKWRGHVLRVEMAKPHYQAKLHVDWREDARELAQVGTTPESQAAKAPAPQQQQQQPLQSQSAPEAYAGGALGAGAVVAAHGSSNPLAVSPAALAAAQAAAEAAAAKRAKAAARSLRPGPVAAPAPADLSQPLQLPNPRNRHKPLKVDLSKPERTPRRSFPAVLPLPLHRLQWQRDKDVGKMYDMYGLVDVSEDDDEDEVGDGSDDGGDLDGSVASCGLKALNVAKRSRTEAPPPRPHLAPPPLPTDAGVSALYYLNYVMAMPVRRNSAAGPAGAVSASVGPGAAAPTSRIGAAVPTPPLATLPNVHSLRENDGGDSDEGGGGTAAAGAGAGAQREPSTCIVDGKECDAGKAKANTAQPRGSRSAAAPPPQPTTKREVKGEMLSMFKVLKSIDYENRKRSAEEQAERLAAAKVEEARRGSSRQAKPRRQPQGASPAAGGALRQPPSSDARLGFAAAWDVDGRGPELGGAAAVGVVEFMDKEDGDEGHGVAFGMAAGAGAGALLGELLARFADSSDDSADEAAGAAHGKVKGMGKGMPQAQAQVEVKAKAARRSGVAPASRTAADSAAKPAGPPADPHAGDDGSVPAAAAAVAAAPPPPEKSLRMASPAAPVSAAASTPGAAAATAAAEAAAAVATLPASIRKATVHNVARSGPGDKHPCSQRGHDKEVADIRAGGQEGHDQEVADTKTGGRNLRSPFTTERLSSEAQRKAGMPTDTESEDPREAPARDGDAKRPAKRRKSGASAAAGIAADLPDKDGGSSGSGGLAGRRSGDFLVVPLGPRPGGPYGGRGSGDNLARFGDDSEGEEVFYDVHDGDDGGAVTPTAGRRSGGGVVVGSGNATVPNGVALRAPDAARGGAGDGGGAGALGIISFMDDEEKEEVGGRFGKNRTAVKLREPGKQPSAAGRERPKRLAEAPQKRKPQPQPQPRQRQGEQMLPLGPQQHPEDTKKEEAQQEDPGPEPKPLRQPHPNRPRGSDGLERRQRPVSSDSDVRSVPMNKEIGSGSGHAVACTPLAPGGGDPAPGGVGGPTSASGSGGKAHTGPLGRQRLGGAAAAGAAAAGAAAAGAAAAGARKAPASAPGSLAKASSRPIAGGLLAATSFVRPSSDVEALAAAWQVHAQGLLAGARDSARMAKRAIQGRTPRGRGRGGARR